MKTRDVLANNFALLKRKTPSLSRLSDIVKAGGGSNGTLGRIPLKETGVSIDALEPLAAVYHIEPWQLLHPDIEATFKQNQPLALIDSAQAATNNIATLEQSLEGLAHYLADLNESDRADVMRSIAVLEKEPERHAKQAAGIRAMVGAAFAPSVRKAA